MMMSNQKIYLLDFGSYVVDFHAVFISYNHIIRGSGVCT